MNSNILKVLVRLLMRSLSFFFFFQFLIQNEVLKSRLYIIFVFEKLLIVIY